MDNQNLGIVNSIDADTIVYLVCYNLREENDVDKCIELVDDFVKTILNLTNSTLYTGFIGSGRTFRHEAYPLYKSKRPPKPDWLEKWESIVRHRLISHWGFVVVHNIEAEDAAIITANHYKHEYNVVLSHIDKDLCFWEGNHFNYQKHEHYYVEKLGWLELVKTKLKGTGLKFMYAQIIMGDSTDGIPGLPGKGPAFA
jgi:5'-3' exonuclease